MAGTSSTNPSALLSTFPRNVKAVVDGAQARALQLRYWRTTEQTAELRKSRKPSTEHPPCARWPAAEQARGPYGTTTQKQAADMIIRPGISKDEVNHAYDLDPWHPLVHLARAGFKKNPISTDFLRGIRSIGYRTIRNPATARPNSCASREKRIWKSGAIRPTRTIWTKSSHRF